MRLDIAELIRWESRTALHLTLDLCCHVLKEGKVISTTLLKLKLETYSTEIGTNLWVIMESTSKSTI